MRDWRNEPMTQEEEEAWDEREEFLRLAGGADRDRWEWEKETWREAHALGNAICNAIANTPPWED